MARKKTHQEFIEEMNIIHPNIEVLSEYDGNKVKVKCKCLIDGFIWFSKPNSMLSQKNGCPKCGGGMKKTQQEFVKKMSVINPDIDIIGKYINCKTRIECKCKICYREWFAFPSELSKGIKCSKCTGKCKKSHDKFVSEIKTINPNVVILGEYINNKVKIKCKCLIDGYVFEIRPGALLAGNGCPLCGGSKKKTHEEFVKEVYNINKDIEIIGSYINAKTKIKCRCKKRHEWLAEPIVLLRGSGCGKCCESKGEKAIAIYCERNSIKYKSQYKLKNCKYKNHLRFDFAIFNKNKLIALIEHQGQQHYFPVDFSGRGTEWAKKEFKLNQKRDQIKRDFCKMNNIPLIEIPYTIKDIEKFLDEKLNKLNINIQLSLTSL